MRKIIPVAAAILMSAGPALAQQSGDGLVVVNVSNVANNIARDLDVNVSNIPVTVQVPVGLAANICNVNANVLAQQRKNGGTAECTAQNSSRALTQIVQRQMTMQ